MAESILPYVFFLFLTACCLAACVYLTRNLDVPAGTILSVSLTIAVVGSTTLYWILRFFLPSPVAALLCVVGVPGVVLTIVLIQCRTNRTFAIFGGFFWKLVHFRSAVFGVLILAFFVGITPYLFRNGLTGDRLEAYDLFATEVMHHLTIVADLDYDVLPQTIHAVPADRSHYHYFANLFIHLFSSSAGVTNHFVLYVYFFVPLCMMMLAIHVYGLTRLLWNRHRIALGAVFVTLFCFDPSALILWVRGVVVEGEAWFGSGYPTFLSVWTPIITQFQLFHNPSYLFSTGLFCGLCGTTILYDRQPAKLWFFLCLIGWVFMIKAKITAFLVGVSALCVVAVLQVVRFRRRHMLLLAGWVVILSIPIFWDSASEARNGVRFSEWFFPLNFGVRSHLISESLRAEVVQHGFPQSMKGVGWFVLTLLVYYLGLLHFRWLGLSYFISRMRLRNIAHQPDGHTFLLFSILGGMGAFVLTANELRKHDSMWFFLLIIFILNIYSVERLSSFFSRKGWVPRCWAGVSLLLMLSGVWSFAVVGLNGASGTRLILDRATMKSFEFLRTAPGQGRILTKYYDLSEPGDESYMAVQVFSRKPVVTEGVAYVFAFAEKDKPYMERLSRVRRDVHTFYDTRSLDSAQAILVNYDIEYIYLRSTDSLHFDWQTMLEPAFLDSGIQILRRK